MNDTLAHVAFDLLDGTGVGRWALDESASSLTIRQRALSGLKRVRGTFTGDVEILADGTAVGVMRTASVRTGLKWRDARPRSARGTLTGRTAVRFTLRFAHR